MFNLFLLSLLVLQSFGSGSVAPKEPLIQFDFSTEPCVNGIFSNTLTSDQDPRLKNVSLYRNPVTTSCSLSMGTESKDTLSSERVDALFFLGTGSNGTRTTTEIVSKPYWEALQSHKNGLSIELWFQTLDLSEDVLPRPILTFSRRTPMEMPRDQEQVDIGTPDNECDKYHFDFQLRQVGSYVEAVFRTSDTIFEPCVRFRFTTLELKYGEMNHLLISLGENYQQLFLNGHDSGAIQEPFRSDIWHWDTANEIDFFQHPGYPDWYGRVHRFSLFSHVFASSQESLPRIQHGLIATEPFPLHQTVALDEFQGNETDYSTPNINLEVVDIGSQVHDLLESLNLTSDIQPSTFYLYITSLPTAGDLFDTTGRNVSGAASLPVLLDDARLLFVPPLHDHSDFPGGQYVSFGYCVSAKEIYSSSHCNAAMLSIIVNPVNDPPDAIFSPEMPTFFEGEGIDQGQFVALRGEDVDDGDYISSIQIVSQPRFGYLTLSVGSFRDDGIPHGTTLYDINNTVAGPEIFVEYIYEGNGRVLQVGSATDSFGFRVADRFGVWSEEKTVPLQILPALVAHPSRQTILEDTEGFVSLYGLDKSNLNRTVGFMIESVPPVSQGFLSNYPQGTQLQKADMVSGSDVYPYNEGVRLKITPSQDFCSHQHRTSLSSISFEYRILAFQNGTVTSVSGPIKQLVDVICVPDSLLLSVQSHVHELRLFQDFTDHPCSGYSFNASNYQPDLCQAAAIIEDIRVSSVDPIPEDAFVRISAAHGLLTLNRDFWGEVSGASDRLEMRSSLEFHADPKRLEDILSFLHFQSFVPGEDAIVVEVQYGSCMSISYDTSSSTCHVTSIRIPVNVASKRPPPRTSYMFRRYQWIPLPFSVTLLFFIKFRGMGREKSLRWQKEKLAKHEAKLSASKTTPEGDSSIAHEWQQFEYEKDGEIVYYYKHSEDGRTTWDAPVDGDFRPARGESFC